MKKLILFLAAACMTTAATADEGMWLLPYLQKMNIKNMKAEGLKLSAEQIYSIDKGSLKDAIVIFGAGCTGEIVSSEGLLFTNHHCGYPNIQALSSVEHDYLKDGFWAGSRQEEIPAPGLTVTFIRHIEDVTAQVLQGVTETGRDSAIEENSAKIIQNLTAKYPGKTVEIKPFFGGNQYFAFVKEIYTDIRLVGAPPSAIGKFGGDTDNWMWPRHTGDFSVFRVYAGVDNRPAAYSKENKPYHTAHNLKVSIKGYEADDFAMIMGFPGTTTRFMTSYEIDELLTVSGPQRVAIRGARQEILTEDMRASDRVRIQYADKYARSSNYWKNTIGKMRGVQNLDVKGLKERQQDAFQAWADAQTQPGYKTALEDIRRSVEGSVAYMGPLQYLAEALVQSVEVMTPAVGVAKLIDEHPDTWRDGLKEKLAPFYKDYNASTDRKVAEKMFEMVSTGVSAENRPSVFPDVINAEFGGKTDAYVDDLYRNTLFTSPENVLTASAEQILNDPAVVLGRSVVAKVNELREKSAPMRTLYADAHRRYIAGLMQMQPQKAWYPDANSTLRLTYGQVLPYSPADGVEYHYQTTLAGVMAKENPASTEFTVPARLKELYLKKDFGRYANARGEMPVAFLANTDITGGNSGSPTLNARGELIGLAFDGNWEAMSGDIAFAPALQRTICVDVRYVLFIIDKFGGAGWLLREMDIK